MARDRAAAFSDRSDEPFDLLIDLIGALSRPLSLRDTVRSIVVDLFVPSVLPLLVAMGRFDGPDPPASSQVLRFWEVIATA